MNGLAFDQGDVEHFCRLLLLVWIFLEPQGPELIILLLFVRRVGGWERPRGSEIHRSRHKVTVLHDFCTLNVLKPKILTTLPIIDPCGPKRPLEGAVRHPRVRAPLE
jgi:hypothetical protein